MAKPTHAELAERIEYVAKLLGDWLPKGQIKRLVRARYGNLDHCTIERYLTRARRMLDAAAGRGRTAKRRVLSEFLNRVGGSRKETTKDRLRAAEMYMRLHGLEQPPPQTLRIIDARALTDDQLAAIAAGEVANAG